MWRWGLNCRELCALSQGNDVWLYWQFFAEREGAAKINRNCALTQQRRPVPLFFFWRSVAKRGKIRVNLSRIILSHDKDWIWRCIGAGGRAGGGKGYKIDAQNRWKSKCLYLLYSQPLFYLKSAYVIGSVTVFYLNNRVFLSRNYRLIVAPRKFDVLYKTNICPRSEALKANMLVLRISSFQGATIRPIVPRQKHSNVFIVHH